MAKKHLIIGAGKAALSALDEIRRSAPSDQVKLISMEDCPPYSPAALIYLLSGKIKETALWLRNADDLRNILIPGKQVIHLVPEKKKVLFRDGSSENYDTLLIASGSRAARPQIEGLDEAGALEFKTLWDCRRLTKELHGRQHVAILGAGLTGLLIGTALLERGYQVSIIEKEKNILPQHFNEEAAVYIEEILADHKAKFFTGSKVEAVKKEKGKIRIALSDGTSLDADILINAAGVTGNVSFLEGTGVKMNSGVLVDRNMRTNIEDIYAAGDAAEAEDFFTGQPKTNAIIPSAVKQGRVAGANMAGGSVEYEGGIPMAAFNFMGNKAYSVGMTTRLDGKDRIISQNDGQKRRFKKIVFDGDRIIGGMFLNENVDPGIFLYLIREKIDLAPYKEALFEGTKPLSDPWLFSLKCYPGSR